MKFLSVAVLVAVVASTSAVSFFSVVLEEWESFKVISLIFVIESTLSNQLIFTHYIITLSNAHVFLIIWYFIYNLLLERPFHFTFPCIQVKWKCLFQLNSFIHVSFSDSLNMVRSMTQRSRSHSA